MTAIEGEFYLEFNWAESDYDSKLCQLLKFESELTLTWLNVR